MRNIIVVDRLTSWKMHTQDIEVIDAYSYLSDERYIDLGNARIYNLCSSYRYQSLGYYVSLLAEARGNRAFPTIHTIQEIKSQSVVRLLSEDIDRLIQKSLSKLKSEQFTLSIYFGKNLAKQYDQLSTHLYNIFQSPLLRATFAFHHKKWQLKGIATISLKDVPKEHFPYVLDFAKSYFRKKHIHAPKRHNSTYDLAILIDPAEKNPPSDKKALANFITAAEHVNLRATLITKDAFSKLPTFDALFIRTTTAVNHYSHRFSIRAQAEGMAVIDDPISIIKCTNKVYLEEIFSKAHVARPKTCIVHKGNVASIGAYIGFPLVIKRPDSSFSQGVIKIDNDADLHHALKDFFKDSELLIAQEFLQTEYDWRIGVLDKQPLFACKYFMVKNHWQICRDQRCGRAETMPISDVPQEILTTATQAANLIGDGLYGVDLKIIDGKVYVIEVNDNPNIDSGCEDRILKEKLYHLIMTSILNRILSKKERRT